jgi:hypothetical protein
MTETDRIESLVAEACEVLAKPATPDRPVGPGLYAIPAGNAVWVELGLDPPSDGRPLYVGKAEDDVFGRLRNYHFKSGKTGWSTVRRSLAGLLREPLGFRGMPRSERRIPAAAGKDPVERTGHGPASSSRVKTALYAGRNGRYWIEPATSRVIFHRGDFQHSSCLFGLLTSMGWKCGTDARRSRDLGASTCPIHLPHDLSVRPDAWKRLEQESRRPDPSRGPLHSE